MREKAYWGAGRRLKAALEVHVGAADGRRPRLAHLHHHLLPPLPPAYAWLTLVWKWTREPSCHISVTSVCPGTTGPANRAYNMGGIEKGGHWKRKCCVNGGL